MIRYTLSEILEPTAGRLLVKGTRYFTGISIDSRTIREGELFIALRGERFDGHDFLEPALKKGGGAVVSCPPVIPVMGKSIIHVDNTLRALQSIARHRRLTRDVKVVAITGTNGKTTTKEMIAEILARDYKVLRSRGNLNNQIGLSLSLTRLNSHRFAVLEMGASRVGDITELSEIARPDICVITNIAPAHLEGFASLDMVRKTKLEIVDYVNTVVVNGVDPYLRPVLPELLSDDRFSVITFGLNAGTDVWAEEIRHLKDGIRFKLHLRDAQAAEIKLRIFGLFNVLNALAAASVCSHLGVPLVNIKGALEEFKGVPMRVEIREMRGATVISDLYNANPASMEEAIKELVRMRQSRAVAVLGDMLELGAYEEEAHRKLGRWLSTHSVDVLITVGELMSYTHEEFNGINCMNGKRPSYHVNTPHEAREILREIVKSGDVVLIKGSRGMKMERILED